MNEHGIYRRLVAGEGGVWLSPLRGALSSVAWLYAAVVATRNRRYDAGGKATVLPVSVISVGNITVGGTGKTPFVIDLVTRLDRMGCSPAVVARGFGAVEGEPNDEERLIRSRCPGVVYAANSDRVAAAQMAHEELGADVIVLDDGFQHRRLHRDLDIVMVDATCPFGFGHVLPRGLLREPVDSLARAHLVVLTRCDQVSAAQLARIQTELRRVAPQARHLECRHRVVGIERLDGTAAPMPSEGQRVVIFAAIGQPRAFAHTVRSLGISIVHQRWWPDHHHYTAREIRALLDLPRAEPHDLVLTTEKDAVKLRALSGVDRAAIGVVKISIDFTGEGDTILTSILERTLGRSSGP